MATRRTSKKSAAKKLAEAEETSIDKEIESSPEVVESPEESIKEEAVKEEPVKEEPVKEESAKEEVEAQVTNSDKQITDIINKLAQTVKSTVKDDPKVDELRKRRQQWRLRGR